jgi:hypothetical protein
LHASVPERHVVWGGVSQAFEALQYPEQQSDAVAAVQASPGPLHVVGGSVHTPLAPHALVQHSSGAEHARPFALQVFCATQAPLHPLLLSQQSAGVAQAWPSCLHAPTGALHVWLAVSQFVEQHSPFEVHAASFDVQTGGGCSVVALFFLHPVTAIASTASADTSSVENLDVRMRPSAGPEASKGSRWSRSVPRFPAVLHVVAGAFDASCQPLARGTHP